MKNSLKFFNNTIFFFAATVVLDHPKNTTSYASRCLFLWFDKFVLWGENQKTIWNLDQDFR